MVKKLIKGLLIISFCIMLTACQNKGSDIQKRNNSDETSKNESQSENELEKTENTIEENKEPRSEFLPTYKELLQQFIDNGIVPQDQKEYYQLLVDSYKVSPYISSKVGKNKDGQYVSINYKYPSSSAIYLVTIYYDNSESVVKLTADILNLDLTFEPFEIYLKNIPNSLTVENPIDYIIENGKKNKAENDLLFDSEITFEQEGVEYIIMQGINKTSPFNNKRFTNYYLEINIDKDYKIKVEQ